VQGEGVAGNPSAGQGDATIDGGGQHEAFVVVGVLADEIHAPRGKRRGCCVVVGGLTE